MNTPADFAVIASQSKWKPAAHHLALNRELVALSNGENDRLMVFMPPRHGKSEIGSKYFPAWYLGKFPGRNVILASATDMLATDFSAAARNVYEEYAPSIFGTSLSADSRASNRWQTNCGGMMRATGIGGGIMGRGADLLVVDDYFGSWEDSISETERRRRHQWIHATMTTRLSPNGVVLIIATRYNKDDPAGRLLKEQEHGGDTWRVIDFPAIAESKDSIGRAPGDALWPEEWPIEKLEQKKRTYHAAGYPWMWESMYQQHPPDTIDSEWPTDFFADHIWFDEWPNIDQVTCRVIAIDPSLGKSDKSDYSAIVMLAKDAVGEYWIDADICRRPSSKIVSDAMEWHRTFRPIALGCETNQFQELLLSEIVQAAEECGENIWPLGINNHLAKVTRIRSLTPHLARHRLHFRRNSPGTSLLVEQLKGFPSHKYDDGPDALEMAVRLCEEVLRGTVNENDQDPGDEEQAVS